MTETALTIQTCLTCQTLCSLHARCVQQTCHHQSVQSNLWLKLYNKFSVQSFAALANMKRWKVLVTGDVLACSLFWCGEIWTQRWFCFGCAGWCTSSTPGGCFHFKSEFKTCWFYDITPSLEPITVQLTQVGCGNLKYPHWQQTFHLGGGHFEMNNIYLS